MGTVAEQLREHRGSLAVTYTIVAVENVFELLYPFAIGLAVDGLLDDDWSGVVVFVAISLAHLVVSLWRQWHDTRAFDRLAVDMATQLVDDQRRAGVDTTTIAARTTLVREYVDFLETDLVTAMTTVFAIVGSLVMLFVYDPVLGLAAAAVALPVVVVNRWLVRRSGRLYRAMNDESEREVHLIATAPTSTVRRHFQLLGGQWIRLSDSEAVSWGIVDVFAVGLSVFALVRTTDGAGEVGAIFATIAYVWAYVGAFEEVPGLLQRLSNLGDIRRRIEALPDGLAAAD